MIRYLFVVGLFICFGTTVFANDMYIQILNAQIEQLTAERDAKRMELDECQDKQKKFSCIIPLALKIFLLVCARLSVIILRLPPWAGQLL